MSTLVRITPANAGWTLVVVEWTHAESLHKYFRSLHLKMSPIRDVPGARVDMDDKGVPHLVKEATDQAFDIQTSPKSLTPVLRDWLKSLD